MDIITAITLFAIKHFYIDFPLQTPYQYLNKGKYGHPGGLLHAALHALGTGLVLALLSIPATSIIICALADGIVHYHVDWAKVYLNTRFKWTPITSDYYWWLVGFDQLLHQATYIIIIAYVLQ